jgi:hypothetical protein
MEELKKTTIKVSGITSIERKDTGEILGYNLIEKVGDKDVKYAIWKTKKDGSKTKAMLDYESRNISIGSEVGIAYKELEREYEFVGKDGQPHKGRSINRSIVWFAPENELKSYYVDQRLKETSDQIKDNEITINQIPF